MRDHGDDDRRHYYEPDCEEPDRADVGAEIAERGEERGPVEERRQDAEEDELRLELEVGHARHEPDREPADDEQDRIRDPHGGGKREERRDDDQEAERDESGLADRGRDVSRPWFG